MPSIKPLLPFLALTIFAVFVNATGTAALADESKPLRALLITGGCCHEYTKQHEAIAKGIQARANVRVDVYWTDNSTTAPVLPLYWKLNWAEGYDIIIHDECAASIKDKAIVNRIVQTHQKIPAVHLHCAMHSFRTGGDAWFKHLGLQSTSHGPQEPIDVKFSDTDHPITATLKDWTTIKEELYNNVKVFDAHSLAVGVQKIGGKNPRTNEAIVVWTNEKQGARSFSTSLGHNTATVEDPRYLELITRGLLWACDKLNDDYLKPYEGENKVTFIDKNKYKAPPKEEDLGKAPKDATLVKATGSSTQSGHPPHHAIDGNTETRWCANGSSYPQSFQIEFAEPHLLKEIEIVWEYTDDRWYQYTVEGSVDGKTWSPLLDHSKSEKAIFGPQALPKSEAFKFVRISGLRSKTGGWCSIRELRVKGDGVGVLWPASPDGKAFVAAQSDRYEKMGNIVPTIEKMTPEEEASILKGVTVPEGFDVTVFAAPPAVNYPVFVAAGVDGTLFVSSDGNGSLGRDPRRGRVIRLRDLDGDGRADETKVFCEVDSPRGLVWDKDRLYLMHPPNLSVFIDHDHDGVADEQKTLVKNLAFGFDKRPADHTTNGLSIGVDGWLYIAGGDFGFIDAEGTDGRKLTHRGGGVIRVQPDGTGLEIYSTGTRNILEVAISPQMDMFARDNTNDGGGWDVRLHHFTGSEDHGYPRLYKNFNDECVQPLADYGGGSGCGAVYIDEPGFGKWNRAPFTADWGTGSLYRHTVQPQGSTFAETAKPESFIKMPRPTDADVDGNSRVYCASWLGATFKWNGPKVGYIVCVRPKDYKPTPLPDFGNASDDELIALLKTPSYRRRMEAQRELLRRGNAAGKMLHEIGVAERSELRNLLAHLQSDATDEECIAALQHTDAVVAHTAVRCLAKRNAFPACFAALDADESDPKPILRALAMMHEPKVVDGLLTRLGKAKPETRKQVLAALCRLHFQEAEWNGDSWGTRPDTRGPYYQPVAWSETEKIAAVLRAELDSADLSDAADLLDLIHRNRIELSDGLQRLLKLATADDKLLDAAIAKLAETKNMPPEGFALLQKAAHKKDASAQLLANTIICLAKINSSDAVEPMLVALVNLEEKKKANNQQDQARKAFVAAKSLEAELPKFIKLAESSTEEPTNFWADVAVLSLASNSQASPETQELATTALEAAWKKTERRGRLMEAALRLKDHSLSEKILAAQNDADAEVASIAKMVVSKLKMKPKAIDNSPKIGSLSIEDAKAKVVAKHGDAELGRQLFEKAKCSSCHTVSKSEPLKGPFLGNINKTYKRPDLADAILQPSKTIAQGFVTNSIITVDGVVKTGFVTAELPDRVTMRDKDSKEFTIMKDDIEVRKTSKISVMPDGLMKEFTTHELSSVLDYLETLKP